MLDSRRVSSIQYRVSSFGDSRFTICDLRFAICGSAPRFWTPAPTYTLRSTTAPISDQCEICYCRQRPVHRCTSYLRSCAHRDQPHNGKKRPHSGQQKPLQSFSLFCACATASGTQRRTFSFNIEKQPNLPLSYSAKAYKKLYIFYGTRR